MTRIKTVDFIVLAIALMPFALWLMIRDSLAERIPIHWNAVGEVDGWADKGHVPLFLGFIAVTGIGVYLLLRFIKYIDPKRTAELNERTGIKIGAGLVIFLSALNVLIILPDTGPLDITTTVFVLVGLLFAFLGNAMYNIKPNYLIGIRLPWTLENEDNWKKTHRLAGIVWFVGGIVAAGLMLLLNARQRFPVFIGITAALALIPSVYSFVLFRKSRRQ